MIKVCHITSVHSSNDVRIFHKECTSLANAGYKVYLVAPGDNYEKDGVQIVGMGDKPTSRMVRMSVWAYRIYKKALSLDAEVYHFHDPELLPYGWLLKRKGKKVIFDSHEHTAESILEKEWISASVQKLVYYLFSRYQAHVCGKFDAVISVTPNVVEYFKNINSNTVQIANFPKMSERCAFPTFREKSIVFAGGLSAQWNHHIVLCAMEQIPDCRYRLCGHADNTYLETLVLLPAWNRTEYIGKIAHDEVSALLSSSSVGMALLSYCRNSDWQNGTIGNTKLFEEMMAGLPVICTDFVLWKEIVERYKCGICVKPDDADAIARAIQYLFEHPCEAKQMGENGRRAIEVAYNWGIEEKKLLTLYNSLEV